MGDILGHNMYAYAMNNPVMMVDPDGEFPLLILVAAVLLFTPVGGTAAQVTTSVVSYARMAITSIWDEEVRADMNAIGWNPFNSNEDKVLNSSKVSFYKGVPVFLKNNGRSGSFYAISLNRNYPIDELKHERGHNWQAMMMGIGTYGLMIGLPSWQEWGPSSRNYYHRPLITADILGGVPSNSVSNGRLGYRNTVDVSRGWWYFGISTTFGPFGYLFLLD